jgi:hypothetical protein
VLDDKCPQIVDALKNRFAFGKQMASRGCQPDAESSAVEKPYVELALKFANVLA